MLSDKIKSDLLTAMKAGDSLVVQTLRMLQSELNYKQIDLHRELTDSDIEQVVTKEVKKRREAIESFTKGGRLESADSEKKELEILQVYLPAQLSETEIRAEISKLISNSAGMDFGAVMKIVSPVMKGRAEGQIVANIVKEILSNKS